jgi:hypothetical protein
MGDDYRIEAGNAVPMSGLAKGVHASLLRALSRSVSSVLLDGVHPVGRITLGRVFEGPDADGWYRGSVSIDPSTLTYKFPSPDPSGAAAFLDAATLSAKVEVAVDQWGQVRYRANCLGRTPPDPRVAWGLPDFHVRCFSPILRRALDS